MKYSKILTHLFTLLCLFLFSCSNNSNQNENSIIPFEDSLLISTKKIDSQTKEEFRILKSKINNQSLKEKAQIWVLIVEKIQTITNEMHNSVDSSFKALTKSNLHAIKSELASKIERYISIIFQINPEIWMAYRNEFPKIVDEAYFEGFNSLNESNIFRAKIFNSISTIENKTITLCNKQVLFSSP